MPYTAVIAMIGALTIIGIPPTSGFMAEWILFNGVLQTGVHDANSFRVVLFGFGILTTVLSSAYILWMYKRIFFGKIPEELVHVKDSNKYVTVTMAALAALTLIIGVYPNPLLNPITGYIQGIFAHTPGVLKIPTTSTAAGQNGSNNGGGVQNYKNMIPSSHEFSNNNIDGYNDIGVIKVASTSKGVLK
jgi:NADH-quinone oxidoreductase subunit M